MTATTVAPGLTPALVEEIARRRQEPDWLRRLRLEALDRFTATPLEAPATGNWRHASLKGLNLDSVRPLPAADTEPESAAATVAPTAAAPGDTADDAGSILLRDGRVIHVRLDDDLARRGVVLAELGEVLRDGSPLAERVQRHFSRVAPLADDPLVALHYAAFRSGVVLLVPRGVVIERPIVAHYAFDDPSLSPLSHTLVVLEDGASASFVESYTSASERGVVASGVVETVLGAGASLRYVQTQRWSAEVWGFSHQRSLVGRDAQLRTLNVALGGRHVRNTVQVVLAENGAQADLLGLVAGSGRQHVDFQTLQEHLGSATRSDLVIHNALDDHASSNFTGLIRIDKQARQTESSQEQKNVLLSPTARADSDPRLEILNNDVVRCTHGAAVGPMDPEMLFYLQARGLPRDEAEALLLEGFFQSVLERLDHPALQARVWEAVETSLQRRPA